MKGNMIHVSDRTFNRLLAMKRDKIRAGEYQNYSFDDLIAELLDLRDEALYQEAVEGQP